MPLLQDNKEYAEKYIELLTVVGSLSKLFSDSTTPYLYYRAAENIFCKAFNAENLSRSDCTADARLDGIGYGLKTFLYKGGKALEKIAEFNAERNLYASHESNLDEFIKIIAELRNRRIEFTMSIHGITEMVYHCVSRDENRFLLHEEKMDLIDIPKIHKVSKNRNSVSFTDGLHEYSFNISKSTLFKKFYINPIREFDVNIFEDPFTLLENLFKEHSHLFEKTEDIYDQIIYLPLYSEQGEIHVPEKSGLNQWNAGGRERHEDELYIPVPARIHRIYPDFFPEQDAPFNLHLPDGTALSAKICQENRKALMSNPNKALGKRLLRDVFKKEPGEVVTYEDLEKIGVDSVEVAKKGNDYYINFKDIGTYEEFKNDNGKE